MGEKYLKWLPSEGIPFLLDFEELRKNDKGLSILLNSKDHTDKILHIRFSDCEALREMGEEFKTRFWHEVDGDIFSPLNVFLTGLILDAGSSILDIIYFGF